MSSSCANRMACSPQPLIFARDWCVKSAAFARKSSSPDTTLWAGSDYINHPDHRAAAQAAVDAVFPASGQPNLFEELAQEGLTAQKARKLYVTVWETQTSISTSKRPSRPR